MFEKFIDNITRKTMHKSAKTVKKEVKKKIDEITTGDNGQKLLVGAVVLSVASMIFSVLMRNSKPVVVNVYNGGYTA